MIWRHLSSGLFYSRSFRLIPALAGTIIPFFWQLINLYGTLSALIIIAAVLQILTITIAVIVYPLLFFKWSFIELYCLAIILMLLAIISWLYVNVSINRRAGFKLIKLQFSSRTALLLLGLFLGNRLLSLSISPQTTFWDLHLKPQLAGQLRSWSREQIVAAINHDYQRALNLLEDAVFFGCSPGSFRKLLNASELKESQYIIMETIIPRESAKIFGLKRPFYFYVLPIRNDLLTAGEKELRAGE